MTTNDDLLEQQHDDDGQSSSFQSILGKNVSIATFFESIWQETCAVFPHHHIREKGAAQMIISNNGNNSEDCDCGVGGSPPPSPSEPPIPLWDEDRVNQNAHEEIIRRGWQVLVHLLEHARDDGDNNRNNNSKTAANAIASHDEVESQQQQQQQGDDCSEDTNNSNTPNSSSTATTARSGYHEVLLFKDQQMLSSSAQGDDLDILYSGSLFAAFLDGCSVVVNRADLLSPWMAALCQDLQRSFPHAYANTYLTPLHQQSVPAHADDRDVLVIQVYGSKRWTVYSEVPVPYPYSHEQVGKAGLDVPPRILRSGKVLIDRTLKPGDVLYIPRGYVHQAVAVAGEKRSDCSFHITVALATHDWSLAGQMTTATQKLLSSVTEYRKAVSVEWGTRDLCKVSDQAKRVLQQQLDQAFELLKQQVTVESVHQQLQLKYSGHNRQVFPLRNKQIQRARILLSSEQQHQSTRSTSSRTPVVVVGREAADRVVLSTIIRKATEEEKARAQNIIMSSSTPGKQLQPMGLHVRECWYESIMSILMKLKSEPHLKCRVMDLGSLILATQGRNGDSSAADYNIMPLSDLTLLCFARRCVELGALAIVQQ